MSREASSEKVSTPALLCRGEVFLLKSKPTDRKDRRMAPMNGKSGAVLRFNMCRATAATKAGKGEGRRPLGGPVLEIFHRQASLLV